MASESKGVEVRGELLVSRPDPLVAYAFALAMAALLLAAFAALALADTKRSLESRVHELEQWRDANTVAIESGDEFENYMRVHVPHGEDADGE